MIMTNEERKRMLDEVDAEVSMKLDGAQIAALSGCSPEELRAIAPADLDSAKLQQLVAIVGDATRSNDQKAAAIRSIAGLTDIAIGLTAKLAKT